MRRVFLMAAASLALVVTNAQSQDADLSEREAEKAIEVRQSLFKLVGWNIGGLGAIARGRADYDAEVVEESAARLSQLAAMIPDAFTANTSALDIKTEAKPGIWSDFDDFKERADAMGVAAETARAHAEAGDEEAAMVAIRQLASTCKACHDVYRAD